MCWRPYRWVVPAGTAPCRLCKFPCKFPMPAFHQSSLPASPASPDVSSLQRLLLSLACLLQFIKMVGRSGKLTYRWEGAAHLPRLLELLYNDAVAGVSWGGRPSKTSPGRGFLLSARPVYACMQEPYGRLGVTMHSCGAAGSTHDRTGRLARPRGAT